MKIYPLRIFNEKANFDFLRIKRVSCFISVFLCILSFVSISIFKLNFGIDFKGGTSIDIKTKNPPNLELIRKTLGVIDIGEVVIQDLGNNNEVSIKFSLKSANQNHKEAVDLVKNKLNMIYNHDEIEYRKIDFVGPQVGAELIKSASLAVSLSFLGIMLYVWFRFEWQFGLGVLISLLHDVIICLGFMSITKLDFNLASVAAILTVIGYSVNDSVVIYDRIRENIRKYKNQTIRNIVNSSINETLSRTTLTVLTTLIANLSLIIFGGEAIKSFSMLVFFGILIGTYSSIFISAPILILFNIEKFK